MSALTNLTIAAARDGLRKKSFSALELTNAYLAAMEKARGLNAYVVETPDKARAMASASDQRLARGEAGPLEGIPLGIKDLFATEGVHTQACSHVLSGFKPPYESTVSANLWRDGAVMLGKLNMDEFAMGSSNETSYYGNVINPWKRRNSNAALVPGGSSGGSAAAVAAHICAAATATDTGGSIRQPAAFTGTVGIKPTYGRCSRWGIVAFASSLDQAGPIARDVRDAAIMLKSMASVDPRDTTSVDMPVPDYEAAVGQPVKGLRVGIPREYRVDGMPAEIDALWQKGAQWLKEQGAESGGDLAARTQSMPCRPITSLRPPRRRRTLPDTMASVTACACRATTSSTCMRTRARQALDARCSAGSSSAPMCSRPAITTPIMCGHRRSAR